jgi:hypothetical protein
MMLTIGKDITELGLIKDTFIVGGPITFDFNICRGVDLFVGVSISFIWYGEG